MRHWIPFLVLALTLLVPAAGASEASEGDAAALRAAIEDLRTGYAPEGWKDVNATVGEQAARIPVTEGPAVTGVYSNPYSSPTHAHQPPAGTYLGYRLTANVSLVTASGEAPSDDENYILKGRLESAAGAVPVRLAKTSPTTFQVVADLDGENRHGYPALTDGGAVTLEVEIYRVPADPSVDPQRVGSTSHRLDFHRGQIRPGGNLFPEANLPGYADASRTNFTRLHPRVVAPDTQVSARITFPGAPGEPARVVLVHETRRVTVFDGTTDADGALQARFQPAEVLPAGADSGMVLLEAHLEGETRVLGSTVVALPVSPNEMGVTTIQYQDRGGSTPSGNSTSTVRVVVEDSSQNPSNNSKRGTLYLMKGTDVFGEASFGPGGSGDAGVRTAQYSASTVLDRAYTSYSLVALFFDEQNNFYSVASARRAASVGIDAEAGKPLEQLEFGVTVENRNENFDDDTDPGLVTTAHIAIRGLPGAQVVRDEVTVPEGAARTVEVPFTPQTAGTYDVDVNVTAGELRFRLLSAVEIREEGGLLSEDDLLQSPAPGPAAAALLVGLAAALRRRR